jgi:hypothetical protein
MARLLAVLGGEAGDLPEAAAPWQVIAPRHRIDFGAERSLEEEWLREFPDTAGPLCKLFGNLKRRGAILEKALTDRSPVALLHRRGQMRLAASAWRPRDGSLPWRPLATLLRGLPDAAARKIVADLFTGLALTPAPDLSIAEAALLWHWATLPEAVDSRRVAELLEKRIGQFYVFALPLAELRTLEVSDRHLTGIVLKNGRRMTGRLFVLQAAAGLKGLPERTRLGAVPASPRRLLWHTSPVQGTLSARLAPQVILTGAPPLRLRRQPDRPEPSILVECVPSGTDPPPSDSEVASRLKTLLPFTTFALKPVACPPTPQTPRRNAGFRPAGLRCLPSQSNLVYAHPAWCGPTTGMESSPTLGFALAERVRQLLRRIS